MRKNEAPTKIAMACIVVRVPGGRPVPWYAESASLRWLRPGLVHAKERGVGRW